MKTDFSYSFHEMARQAGLELAPFCLEATQHKTKCRFWCRLRGSASFISPLNWTEVGLKHISKLNLWVGALPRDSYSEQDSMYIRVQFTNSWARCH